MYHVIERGRVTFAGGVPEPFPIYFKKDTGGIMNEKAFTLYISDLEMSDNSKEFLLHAGLRTLDDLMSCDFNNLSTLHGISDNILSELSDVIAHADDIASTFENRNKRIREIPSEIQNESIEKLGLSTRSYNALNKANINTVGDLIRMSSKDIFKLRNVGVLSQNEIIAMIERIEQSGNALFRENDDAPVKSLSEADAIDSIPFSVRARNALRKANIQTVGALIELKGNDLSALYGVGQQTRDEILSVINSFLEEKRKNLVNEILPEVSTISVDDIPFSVRAVNALRKANIQTVGELITLTEKDIISLYRVGQQTKDEILAVIDSILEYGKGYFDRLSDGITTCSEDTESESLENKGFDFSTIDILTEKFNFKPIKMTEWFGLSRQRIYNILDRRLPSRKSIWTGKVLSNREYEILTGLLEKRCFDYSDAEVTCCCMNNKQDNFACLFIYENEIKCFFLQDLPDDIRNCIVDRKMHKYTERELAGESNGNIVYVLTKPFFCPNNPSRFKANAQLRGLTSDEYALFISGYPYVDQHSITDEQIISFMQENLIDGKVYISSDPKNHWIRAIASRNGYSIKNLIELYGFESRLDRLEFTTDGTKERHCEELQKYIIYDNLVYFPTDSHIFKMLHTYTYKKGLNLNSYIRSLGFERTTERPNIVDNVLEDDMEVRQSDGTYEDIIFAKYPLIGSRILNPEAIDKLNSNARKYIDLVLSDSSTKLSLNAEMQITLAIINNAKKWTFEENSNFWNYISLQLGYRDTKETVARLLQTSLEHAMKQNNRLFLEDVNGRAFKSTVLIHALSPKKSWMALFDFLFEFYKNNLNWRMIPNDPLIANMIHALQQKLFGGNEEEIELTISSKMYSFQEGIRKLILYRPAYARTIFEKLIGKIDSLVNSEIRPVETYEEALCEEWFKEKIIAITNTKKTEKKLQSGQHDIAIDYSRIHAKYILKNENDLQLVLPDIRLKNDDINRATLFVSCNGKNVIQRNLAWYGNELGKTLTGISFSLPTDTQMGSGLNVQVQIMCDNEMIYDSEENLNRSILLFFGSTEVAKGKIKRDRYTLIVPESTKIETENIDIFEIESLVNPGLKGYFLELKDGYIITLNGRLFVFDNENGTDVKVITPKESTTLPTVTLQEMEAYLAYRKSTCKIIFGNSDYFHQYVLLKDGEKIDLSSLQCSENGLVFIFPLDEKKETIHLQIINLAEEKLVFDRFFILITEVNCCFNREFYYAASDYEDAKYSVEIDDFSEVIPFTKDDTEIRIPFRDGELHADIPKVSIQETSGEWLQDLQPAWYIGAIPQTSLLKITKPTRVDIRFFVGSNNVLCDGQGKVAIGNVLQTFTRTESLVDVNIEMQILGKEQKSSYIIAKVFYKERFLKNPVFWSDEKKLFWDHGGEFVGKDGREFTLILKSSNEEVYEFKLDENTEYITLPENMPIGNYHYEISIQSGGLFRRIKEIVATGNCIIGDKNLLRFMNRRIIVESITDMIKEKAGHIVIRTCYIDQIRFCGMEETSEGYCPIYKGILFTLGYHGERYEFSYDVHTNKKGISKMMVNPVRIVYISDTTLCITDSDGDGLYYYNYYDRNLESVVYALTDREYTKANEGKYSSADLYLYRTERM